MSASDKVPVYVATVRNTSIARYSDEYFQQYTYRTDVWADLSAFCLNSFTMHPRADIDISVQMLYRRELDSMPSHASHNPSNKTLKEVDR